MSAKFSPAEKADPESSMNLATLPSLSSCISASVITRSLSPSHLVRSEQSEGRRRGIPIDDRINLDPASLLVLIPLPPR